MKSPEGAKGDGASVDARVPISMISGFLGCGKTTLLRYLLENQASMKFGVIVNDVATINVDAKLIRNDRNRGRDQQLNTTADLTDTIELANGCACCSIKDELFDSLEQLVDLADKRGVPFDRLVLENSGVAEPHAIRDRFADATAAGHPLMKRVRLEGLVTVLDCGTFLADYASRAPLMARPELGEGGNLRPVVDLLVEQLECADYVLLNKTDLLEEGQLDELRPIVASLNPFATVIPCVQGRVPLEEVFGTKAHAIVSGLNIEGHHRGAVAAARSQAQSAPEPQDEPASSDCAACAHEQQHGSTSGHDHSGHSHKHTESSGHDHQHDHSQGEGSGGDRQETSAAKRFGIRSFVYSRRTPFHPQRLKTLVLRWLPVTKNKATGEAAPPPGPSPIKAVLRSKGFMWMSNSHGTAYYWSHAGMHFEIRDEGDWWAAVPDSEWPQEAKARATVLADFDGPEWGDRRQEIVFIGSGMDQAAICSQLDEALLTADEMQRYRHNWSQKPDPPHNLH